MSLAIAFRFEGGHVFRNVRPLAMLKEEFQQQKIEYVQIDPANLKHGSWQLILVFKDKETRQQYESGKIKYNPTWLPGKHKIQQRINPLKAAKRAASRRR